MYKEYLHYLTVLGILLILHGVVTARELPAASAGQQSPTALIQRTADQLLEQLDRQPPANSDDADQLHALVGQTVVPHLDMPRIARIVLGKHVRRINGDQFAAFTAEFQTLLIRTYATSLQQVSGKKIDVMPARYAENGTASVQMNVLRPNGRPVAVTFLTHNRGGPWQVYDIRIEGISLVTNYRSEFSDVLGQGGFDALMKKLKSRNRQPQLAAN